MAVRKGSAPSVPVLASGSPESPPSGQERLYIRSGVLYRKDSAGTETAIGGGAAAVTSVAGKTGDVTLVQGDVGLGSVDNTSDVNKPVSTATQTALNAKVDETVSVIAGNGLSGGGTLAASRTLTVGAGTGITVAATTVAVDFAASGTSSTTEAVRADDSRLSNARTPTAHTHVATTDLTATGTKSSSTFLRGDNTWAIPPVPTAIPQANVTNLVSDLAAKEDLLPVGIIQIYAGAGSIPTGWLLCNGLAYSRTGNYAALFNALTANGTTFPYGAGNGSTTFNVPDLASRIPVGLGLSTGATSLGSSDGDVDGSRSPSHAHNSGTLATSATGATANRQNGTNISMPTAAHTHAVTGTTASTQGWNSGEFPFLVINYIIRAY